MQFQTGGLCLYLQNFRKPSKPSKGRRTQGIPHHIDVYTKQHQNTPKVRRCQKAWQWFFTIKLFSPSAVCSHFHHRKNPCAFTNILWAFIDHERIAWSTWIAFLQNGTIFTIFHTSTRSCGPMILKHPKPKGLGKKLFFKVVLVLLTM